MDETLKALSEAFPAALLIVADDASIDGTPERAAARGATVVRTPRRLGKGGAATLGARMLLETARPGDGNEAAGANDPATILLCDGDLGHSALRLPALVEALDESGGDLAVAAFSQRVGGGFGIALRFARWAVGKLTGLELAAPISGQRALRPQVLPAVLPFAERFGMEIGMTVDAHRAGFTIIEVELDLEHRVTGRSLAGFLHRGRQLLDFVRVYASRRATEPG